MPIAKRLTLRAVLATLTIAMTLASLSQSHCAYGFSKPKKLAREDSLALFPSPPESTPDTTSEVQPALRSLEIVQLDSVVALLTLADAHFSVHNYEKAGLFIRAAFAQYARVNEARDYLPENRADSIYTELVSKYKSYLAKQPVLPPETPLSVLLNEDTEHINVPKATRQRVDELLKLTPKEHIAFQKMLPPAKLNDLTKRQDQLPPIPIETNQRVEKAMTFFMTRGKAVYERWLERSGRLMPIIVPILREEGIPEEIFCLAMIESGLNPQAYSRARAAGVYQFIGETGARYGLQSGWWVDDRRNIEKSTRAACGYLRTLYNQFGDWNLAIASYNCGEGRIARNIKREKTKDYWKMRRLPRETRNYIPTFLAALILYQDPERWGFHRPQIQSPMESDTVMVDGVVDLSVASNSLGIPYDELKWRNLELMQFCTDPTVDRYPLRVPRGMGKLLLDTLRKLERDQKIRWTDHVVRKGETLRSISRKYGLSEKAISALPWNASVIRGKRNVVVGATLKFPMPVGQLSANALPPGAAGSTTPLPERERDFVVVKRGQTLSKIAVDNETTVGNLLSWNNLKRGSVLRIGQRIWIDPPLAKAIDKPVASSAPAPIPEPASQTTRANEVAQPIDKPVAAAMSDSTKAVQSQSTVEKTIEPKTEKAKLQPDKPVTIELTASQVQPVLADSSKVQEPVAVIEQPAEQFLEIEVKSGDSLARIAKRNNVTLQQLLDWNELDDPDVIHPGMKLQIKKM